MGIRGARLIGLIAGLLSMLSAAAADTKDDVATLVAGNNAFALDLYSKLAATTSGNLFFSPYSIRTALAMTYAGAHGRTAEQMRQVLHFALPDDRLHVAFAALAAELNKRAVVDNQPAYELTVANALWGQGGYAYNTDFLKLLQQDYSSELRQADFTSAQAVERARLDINQWVKERTHDKIADMLAPGILSGSTRLLLIDAIHFKATWAEQFNLDRTEKQPFYRGIGHGALAWLMFGYRTARAMENDDLQAIGLPYSGYGVSMVILLPRKMDSLPSLEKQLTIENLNRWMAKFQLYDAEVYLPKFTTQGNFKLKRVLGSMGVADAFDPNQSDFSGIAAAERLYVHDVIHKTFVGVNEEGTEATAATSSELAVAGGVRHPSIRFRADHPFLFLIRDESTGAILFTGRLTDPRG
jgi:serpin B